MDKTINMASFLMATELFNTVRGCILNSEAALVHREFYEICKQHLGEMAQKRLEPSRN